MWNKDTPLLVWGRWSHLHTKVGCPTGPNSSTVGGPIRSLFGLFGGVNVLEVNVPVEVNGWGLLPPVTRSASNPGSRT